MNIKSKQSGKERQEQIRALGENALVFSGAIKRLCVVVELPFSTTRLHHQVDPNLSVKFLYGKGQVT